MGNFGKAMRDRINTLKNKGADMPKILAESQELATLYAIDKATEMTPPNNDTALRGTGAITGQAKAHWASDSISRPEVTGDEYKTILANNMHYISYLNDGHRMDMHFVPGLMINPYNGLLEKVDPEMGGIMVGTKTKYVKGLYMKQAAINVYKDMMLEQLNSEIRGLFE